MRTWHRINTRSTWTFLFLIGSLELGCSLHSAPSATGPLAPAGADGAPGSSGSTSLAGKTGSQGPPGTRGPELDASEERAQVVGTTGADEYTKDLDRICHVHEITGKSADLGLEAVSQWLLENIRTVEARHRFSELSRAGIPIWLQNLRRDAAARGISPCPFSDVWEAKLKSSRK